jgi:mono/diheme cytochrome c family protein
VSFTIHRVTQRAHGGDPIKRDKRIDGDVARVGRGTDADIQLPDLAIGLHHANIRIIGRGRVRVEAIGEQTFEINGRIVRHTEFRIADKPQLLFAHYLLAFAAGSSDDDVDITISQIAGNGEASDASDVRKVFSLSSIMFSPRRAAWLIAFLILVAGLGAPVGYYLSGTAEKTINPDEPWSVGPLSQGHFFLQHDCKACHADAFRAIPDSACLSCHQEGLDTRATRELAERVRSLGDRDYPPLPVKDHADPALLMRSQSEGAPASNGVVAAFMDALGHPKEHCTSCHTDHVGTAGQQRPGLTASHPTSRQVLAANCASCHGNMKSRLPDTALHDVADWEHHPDFQSLIASLAAAGRPKFEGDAVSDGPFDTGLSFSHKSHLQPTGDVAREAAQYSKPVTKDGRLSCRACHQTDTEGRGFLPIDMPRDCSACHAITIRGVNGEPEILAHGHPEVVVTQMRAYYATGRMPAFGAARLRHGVSASAAAASQSTSVMPESEIVRNIQDMFLSKGPGEHTCAGCHVFEPPSDPSSTVFRLKKQVHLVNRYLPQSGFDHSVREHQVDARGSPTCLTCHAATKSDSLSNVVIPGIAQCKACHGSAAAPSGETAPANCTECHGFHKSDADRTALDNPPTHEIHRGAWKIPDGI